MTSKYTRTTLAAVIAIGSAVALSACDTMRDTEAVAAPQQPATDVAIVVRDAETAAERAAAAAERAEQAAQRAAEAAERAQRAFQLSQQK